jgi:transcriptional regulator with XRE-family HTH domain
VVKSTLTTCAQVAEVTVEITLLDRVAHRARAGQGKKLKKKVKEVPMILVRQEIGEVLRDVRLQKGRTLRQVAGRASVALGYLSEVERGQKEASSEILASVADALDTPISVIMREVGDRLAILEGVSVVPDTLTDELVAQFDVGLALR